MCAHIPVQHQYPRTHLGAIIVREAGPGRPFEIAPFGYYILMARRVDAAFAR